MSNQDLLTIYLHDHHAGAKGALELLERIEESNSDNTFGQHAKKLRLEFQQDKQVLEDIMAAVDVTPSATKDAGAWVVEKLARLKLNGRVVDYSPLSRVVEFEALAVGLSGRLRLWPALKIARQADERLAGFDFDHLLERTCQQRDDVEKLHAQACEGAFVQAESQAAPLVTEPACE